MIVEMPPTGMCLYVDEDIRAFRPARVSDLWAGRCWHCGWVHLLHHTALRVCSNSGCFLPYGDDDSALSIQPMAQDLQDVLLGSYAVGGVQAVAAVVAQAWSDGGLAAYAVVR